MGIIGKFKYWIGIKKPDVNYKTAKFKLGFMNKPSFEMYAPMNMLVSAGKEVEKEYRQENEIPLDEVLEAEKDFDKLNAMDNKRILLFKIQQYNKMVALVESQRLALLAFAEEAEQISNEAWFTAKATKKITDIIPKDKFNWGTILIIGVIILFVIAAVIVVLNPTMMQDLAKGVANSPNMLTATK